MSMSKQDFELVAQLIRHAPERFKSNKAHAEFAFETAIQLADTNPRFDARRFVLASMPKWMVGTKHSNAWERAADGAAGVLAARADFNRAMPRTTGPTA